MSELLAIETDSGLWLGGWRDHRMDGNSRPAVGLQTATGRRYATVLASGRLRGVRYQGERLRARAWTEADQARADARKALTCEISRMLAKAYPVVSRHYYDDMDNIDAAHAEAERIWLPQAERLKAEHRETYGYDERGPVFEVAP